MLTRRDLLIVAAALPLRAQIKPLRNLGGAPAGFPVRSRAARDANRPFDFLEHCHSLGLGIVELRQTPDPAAARDLRQKLEAYGMRAVGNAPLPRDAAALDAFEAAVKANKEAGVLSLHAAMTARRYEEFDNFEAFQQNFERCKKTVALVEPVLRKHQMRLGLENHKGWRSAEQAAWLQKLGSQWVGVHFDFGNNVALCEDPAETLGNLAPWTFTCHIKDMAVEPYEEGFLLSEVPLGEGFLDLKGMVAALQKKDPNMPFDLEMITRDPLKIPIFTKKYWATFDDVYSPLPGRDVAHIIDLVRKNKPKSPLPKLTGLSPAAQLQLEDDCVNRSIAWARENLNV